MPIDGYNVRTYPQPIPEDHEALQIYAERNSFIPGYIIIDCETKRAFEFISGAWADVTKTWRARSNA